MQELPIVDQPPPRCGALLDNVARKLRVHSLAVLHPLGLRPRHLVALTVIRGRNGLLQSELADELQLDSTNVVGLLNELEAEGLIERRRSTTDRRRHNVLLTDAGNAKLAQAERALDAAENAVFGRLDTDDRSTLYALLAKATTPSTEACLESLTE
ncbi:MarR family winged helix-turn-helix transcriptional regulator [Microlunatus sp. Gsoil 973]|uniref:MarR family winged helix-turn-helix transcriptional regulator n=1 Tax=Microlunatus sp. Gsoil 973 TaxID=2672569 RepID=UPI0012B4AFB9|nr:MarR family winged helix-turn-helix transcriptional regulator [Microlunatus sp. Gsoil 973]QGN34207.1 MarR family transcriptional regulator [Microlunatus sp. Gsoil 973]